MLNGRKDNNPISCYIQVESKNSQRDLDDIARSIKLETVEPLETEQVQHGYTISVWNSKRHERNGVVDRVCLEEIQRGGFRKKLRLEQTEKSEKEYHSCSEKNQDFSTERITAQNSQNLEDAGQHSDSSGFSDTFDEICGYYVGDTEDEDGTLSGRDVSLERWSVDAKNSKEEIGSERAFLRKTNSSKDHTQPLHSNKNEFLHARQYWVYETAHIIRQQLETFIEPLEIVNSVLVFLSNNLLKLLERFGVIVANNATVDQTRKSLLSVLSTLTEVSPFMFLDNDVSSSCVSKKNITLKMLGSWTNPHFVKCLVEMSLEELNALKLPKFKNPWRIPILRNYKEYGSFYTIPEDDLFLVGMRSIVEDIFEELWRRVKLTLSCFDKATISSLLEELRICCSQDNDSISLLKGSLSDRLSALQLPQLYIEAERLLRCSILPNDLRLKAAPILERIRTVTEMWRVERLESRTSLNKEQNTEELCVPNREGCEEGSSETSSTRSCLTSTPVPSFGSFDSNELNTGAEEAVNKCSPPKERAKTRHYSSLLRQQEETTVPKDRRSKQLYEQTVQKFCQGMTSTEIEKTLTCGIKGIYFNKSREVWQCHFTANDGKRRIKTFPVKKLGFEEAKRLAIEFQTERQQLHPSNITRNSNNTNCSDNLVD